MEMNCSTISLSPNNHIDSAEPTNDIDPPIQQIVQQQPDIPSSWKRFLGILLAISSSLSFSLTVALVKYMTHYHSFVLSSWRYQGALFPSFFIISYEWMVKSKPVFGPIYPFSITDNRKNLLMLLICDFAGTCAIIFQFSSLKYLSAADSTVIGVTIPISVSLVAHCFLKEKTGIIPIFCGVLALIGVTAIARPPLLTGQNSFDTDTLIGIFFALCDVFFSTWYYVLVRRLSHVHYGVMLMFYGAWGLIQCLALNIATSTYKLPESLHDWMICVLISSLSFANLASVVLASKCEQIGTVIISKKCGDIILVYLWEYILIGAIPDEYSVIGAILVGIGVVLVAMRKVVQDLPDDHPARQRFGVLFK